MRTRLRRAAFLLMMLVCLHSTTLRLLAFSEETCYCGQGSLSPYGYVFLYDYNYGQYWNFIDEWSVQDTFYTPTGSGPQCHALCQSDFIQIARSMCSAYGGTNRHIQFQYWWYFYDSDNSNGGTDEGYEDTGPNNIVMCGSF